MLPPHTLASPPPSFACRVRYELRIVPPSSIKAEALREVRAGAVGQLVRIRAMVTRVSDVQPLVSVVTYTCDACG